MDSSGLLEEVQRHLEQAYAYEESGDLENGLRECELVIQLAPELAEAHNLRGIILDELGQKEEAIAAYREAVRLAPTFREARHNLHEALAEKRERANRLVTVRVFVYAVHAHLAKALLAANGIHAFVADDGIVAANPLLSQAIGGVRLLVRDEDAPAAIRILKQSARSGDQMDGLQGTAENTECPRCHSTATHFEKYWLRLLALTWLLLGIPLPFVLKRWRCDRCGYTWRETR